MSNTVYAFLRRSSSGGVELIRQDPMSIGSVIGGEDKVSLADDIVYLNDLLITKASVLYVDDAVANANLLILKGQVDSLAALPTDGNTIGDLWLVGASSPYAKYAYLETSEGVSQFKHVGDMESSIDLSVYYTKEQMDTISSDHSEQVSTLEARIASLEEMVLELAAKIPDA